jgi:hypothetical protein
VLLAVTSIGAATARLVRIDLATGSLEVLAEDDKADVSGVHLHNEPGSRRSSRC